MKEKLRKYMTELSSLHGVPGGEQEVAVYLRDRIKDYADEVRIDSFGNVFALRKGSTEKNGVMIPAHMDEVGLVVKKVEDNGFLRFTSLGYPNQLILSGSRVKVGGKYIGVVGTAWERGSFC